MLLLNLLKLDITINPKIKNLYFCNVFHFYGFYLPPPHADIEKNACTA
jgi:hypothetical protein